MQDAEMSRKECESGYPTAQRGSARGPALRVGRGCAAAVGLTLLVGSLASAASIRLWPSAVTDGELIRLQDVARLEGFAPELRQRAGMVVVARAPQPGGRITITLEDIRQQLYEAGVNLATVLLRGSGSCEVSRPMREPAQPRVKPEPSDASSDRQARWPAPAGPHGPRTLEWALREHIAASLAHLDGRVQVRFSRASQQALSLSEPEYTFRIQNRTNRALGLVSFDVQVFRNGTLAQRVPIVAEVALVKPVVVARRPINRGAIIRAKDVALTERRFTRLEDIGLTDLAAVVGQEARRFMERGTLIRARDVRPLPLVRRGQLVTVWNRSGPIVVKAVGKALDSGSYGQVVQVKSERSGQTFYATVSGPRTVVIGPDVQAAGTVHAGPQTYSMAPQGSGEPWSAGAGGFGSQAPQAK